MKSLLFLHGALGSKAQFNELSELLKNDFNVSSISFSGHGSSGNKDTEFSIALFCSDVLNWVKLNDTGPLNLFGYSMGGYVALYMARFYPELVKSVFTLATKFNWTKESAEREAALLNPEVIELKFPSFVALLKENHDSNWKNVVIKTAEMMVGLGARNPLSESDFTQIKCKVILGLGELDKMVTLHETEKVKNRISGCEMVILNDTPHPFEKVNLLKLSDKIKAAF